LSPDETLGRETVSNTILTSDWKVNHDVAEVAVDVSSVIEEANLVSGHV
jgi:hypothetical protein